MKRLAIALAGLLAAFSSLGAQQQYLEVQQSDGFVEALLADVGWRQAVVGRQLPAGSVLTSWINATAKIGYRDSVVSVEAFTHLTVLEVRPDLVRLSLEAGGINVDSARLPYEIQYRGMVIRLEKGNVVLSNGVLTTREGSVEVSGTGEAPLTVPAGASVDLLAPGEGPVFPASRDGMP